MLEVTMVEHPAACARAFVVPGPPDVSLVVWDRDSDLHTVGEVWAVYVGGRPAQCVTGVTEQLESVVFAARAHYGRRLHVLPSQRGLSAVEARVLASAGLVVS
jgi:hypothetical protein